MNSEATIVKDQSAAAGGSRLRYPLRSATKSKEEKPAVSDLPNNSASKRGRPSSDVSKSMGVLEVSGNTSAGKPPRRLSILTKSTGSATKSIGNITPIAETRAKRSVSCSDGKSDTPNSQASRSSSRQKFKLLSSASYWLSQIKLSEADAKHSISLAFFKLALEAGCEDIQRLRDGLRSYARKHSLVEHGETLKGLFESYNIAENLEQLQVSETCSQVPDDDANSSSTMGNGGLKPKSLNADVQALSMTESAAKKEKPQKNAPTKRTRVSSVRNSVQHSKVVSDTKGRATQNKTQGSMKKDSDKVKNKAKNQEKLSDEEGSVNRSPTKEGLLENKENIVTDASEMKEISVNEE